MSFSSRVLNWVQRLSGIESPTNYFLKYQIVVYLMWFAYIKIFKKNPVTISQHHIIWLGNSVKSLIFIIWFCCGKTDQLNGASFMLFLVVKFGQILPIRSTYFGFFFFADFHWDISGNWVNIYILSYNTVVLKKIAKTFTTYSFRTPFAQKLG